MDNERNYSINNYYEERLDGENKYSDDKEKLFYAIMYRRWDAVYKIIKEKSWKWADIKNIYKKDYEEVTIEGVTIEGVTIEHCFEYNLDYLKSPKNKVIYGKICEALKGDSENTGFQDIESKGEGRYDKKFYNGKSAIDVFWGGNQPVLNLKYYEKQTMAAKQVMKNGCSMVLDEVGTGKTVAGIFTIQQVIQERIDHPKDDKKSQVSILIVCPHNKREDWHSDILRQLGRESIVIDKSDDGKNIWKKSRKHGVPSIYISGNTGAEGDGSNSQLKESLFQYEGTSPWDLVIIDECHMCFDNYKKIRSEKILLLTATPIVVSGNVAREFKDYVLLMNGILGGDPYNKKVTKEIDPIEKQDYTEDDIFVCNFKEDIFKNITINRRIEFKECERDKSREKYFNKLREEKDFFSAIFSDQDDNRLLDKMRETFDTEPFPDIDKNYKLEALKNIIEKARDESKARDKSKEKDESFLIFCETTDTIDLIYDKISVLSDDTLLIGKLYSKVAEVKNKQVNNDTIIPLLKEHMRNKGQSILITTGKSGGTGLNLGEFNTVIHYELPFTSNELEQRFGRIERADDLIDQESSEGKKTIENKMIFLINKSVKEQDKEQWDFITNRMLYYAINKINITVDHMPIRNTVLFHKDYIKRVKEQALIIWGEVQKRLEQPDEEKDINEFFEYRKERCKVEKIINEGPNEKIGGESIVNIVKKLMEDSNKDDFSEEEGKTLKNFYNEYLKNDNKAKKIECRGEKIKEYVEYYLWLRRTLSFWGNNNEDEDNKEDENNKDIFMKYNKAVQDKTKAELVDNIDDEKTQSEELESSLDRVMEIEKKQSEGLESSLDCVMEMLQNYDDGRIGYIKGHIKKIQRELDSLDIDKNNSYSGVFYRKENGRIVNKKFN